MAANGLKTSEANRILDNSIPAGSTVVLASAMGSATTASTTMTGSTAQTPAWGAASAASKSNSATVTYACSAAGTAVGVEVSNTAPAATWFSPFSASRTVNPGDSVVFAVGGMAFNLANGT